MKQDTTNRFAAILAAAQAKANAQATPKFSSDIKAGDTVKYKGADIQAIVNDIDNTPPLKSANITFTDGKTEYAYIDDLQKVTPTPQPEPAPEPQASPLQELSTMTVEELLNEPAPVYCAPMTFESPTQKQPAFKIVDYSPKSFAILTASKPAEDILNIFRQHGTFNSHLKCGKGWIFSKRHLPAIKEKLGIKWLKQPICKNSPALLIISISD